MRAVILFFLVIQGINALRILVLFPHPGQSHFGVFRPLFKALSEKGHYVTVVSHFPELNHTEHYQDISLKGTTNTLLEVINFETVTGSRYEKYTGGLLINDFARISCATSLKTKQVHQLLESKDSYDVILIEMFNSHCFAGFIEKFIAPFIGLSSHVLMPWANDWLGNPDNPAYVPNIFMDFSDTIDFFGRVENTVMQIFTKLYYKYIVTPESREYSRDYLGMNVPKDVMYNASAVLVNSHFTLNRPRPVVPGVIEVGGMHVGKIKPLPKVR